MNLRKKLQLFIVLMCASTFAWAQTGVITLGAGAGQNNTNNYTTYIGHQSGMSGDGFGNTFLGSFTGVTNTGWSNTFLGNNNVFVGFQAGHSNTTGSKNIFIGKDSGKNNTGNSNIFIGYTNGSFNTGEHNTFVGSSAGKYNTSGRKNTFLGNISGPNNTTGSENTFVGYGAGHDNSEGDDNTALGYYASRNTTTGNRNLSLGYYSHYNNISGGYNTILGTYAGFNATGSSNVFIGHKAGYNETGSNKLYIDNSSTTAPLIYGDFSANQVGINTGDIPAGYAFAVKGKAITEEVKVRSHNNWPDYVFEADYHLSPLTTLENDIKTLGHLPGVPSAEEVKENGFHLGEMDATLLEKVEELTLYIIQMDKEMKTMNNNIQELRTENQNLKNQLKTIDK